MASDPTQVIHDAFNADDRRCSIPRYVLKKVLDARRQGLRRSSPGSAPPGQRQHDPDRRWCRRSPPRPERSQAYGIDATNEFDQIFEDVLPLENGDVDTLTHASGAAQMEINFNHGTVELADQAFPPSARCGRRR